MQFFTALLSALILASSTNTTPLHIVEHTDLILVTLPGEGETWPVGSMQLVTWDISIIPDSGKDHTGVILLGYYDGNSLSEHLNYRVWFKPSLGWSGTKLPQHYSLACE
jgi:hypothetical protein